MESILGKVSILAGVTSLGLVLTWPNLNVLDNYPNPHGTSCSIDGATTSGNKPSGRKLESNRLKNRYTLPPSFTVMKLSDLLSLQPKELKYESLGVTVWGYVRDVKSGGTSGESCNCGAKGKAQADAHIEVVLDANALGDGGKGMAVVEITERSRRLAALGLLKSNIGQDWTTRRLRDQLLGRWVRFSGWLLYDEDHHLESWNVDPDDKRGRKNWRGTCWEVHPVMAIEKLEGKPAKS